MLNGRGILAQEDDIFSWARRGGKLVERRDGECAYKAMGTLTSYEGAIFVGRRGGKGSTGFCWLSQLVSWLLLDLDIWIKNQH
jgi:hypothetical protein